MFKYVLIFTLLVELTSGYINIYPSFFYEELPKEGLNKSFVLTNRTKEEIRYRLYIEDKILEKEEMEIEIYPKSITLSPREEKKVKIAIKPNVLLEKGIYNRILVVKEVPMPLSKRKNILTEFKMNLGLYYGDVELILKIDTEETKEGLKLKLENNGEKVGLLNIYIKEKKEENFIDSFVLRKKESYEKIITSVQEGSYLLIRDEKGKEIKKILVKGVR
ncbi:MAG: hypothetical protein ACRC0S_00075 [Fusobacteriaceae bacterium]